ncbi:uncharacterized protein LOC107857272 [Capsicum annuum]|uniref:uncharacterized protein LOC107857272 n=1 Tax=Capsicum annuum TaxID=4072 RepID=UPI001FB0D6E8|nr:uncharacterized protein LOC107857272 [Capsicum annuum]
MGGAPTINNVDEMDIVTRSKEKGKKVVGNINKSLEKSFGDDIREETIVVRTIVMYKNNPSLDISYCFSADVGTSTLNALIEEVVNQEPKDIGAATFDSLVKAVVNQKLDYSKVKTAMIENIHKDHTDVYLSTIPEFTQAEIDAIMEAPVDDIPLCVVKSIEETLNPHFIFDSQLSLDFPDIVVAAHQATKIPAKRTRTKSKVFKSLYLTEYASGSKTLENETTCLK